MIHLLVLIPLTIPEVAMMDMHKNYLQLKLCPQEAHREALQVQAEVYIPACADVESVNFVMEAVSLAHLVPIHVLMASLAQGILMGVVTVDAIQQPRV